MVSPSDLVSVASQAARKRLPAHSVDHVEIESMTAANGDDALRVVVILSDEVVRPLSGDLLMDTSLAVAWALEREGEPRFALVEYRNRDEDGIDADPEA